MIAAALGFNTIIFAALLEDVLAPYKSPPTQGLNDIYVVPS